LTEFWDQMNGQFGAEYATSVARDYVLADLGGLTVSQALADGVDVKTIWIAICDAFGVPEGRR
jgi:hypothetical protein